LPGRTDPLPRLTIAQDTGSAITGPARGDFFVGSGAAAGTQAGLMRHPVGSWCCARKRARRERDGPPTRRAPLAR
jgi:membrane-bound lytic murein transglycosylase